MDQFNNQDPHKVVFLGLKKLVSKLYSVTMTLYQRTEENEKNHYKHLEEFDRFLFNNESKLDRMTQQITSIKEEQEKNVKKLNDLIYYIETQKMRVDSFAAIWKFIKNHFGWFFSILGTAMGGMIIWLKIGQNKKNRT